MWALIGVTQASTLYEQTLKERFERGKSTVSYNLEHDYLLVLLQLLRMWSSYYQRMMVWMVTAGKTPSKIRYNGFKRLGHKDRNDLTTWRYNPCGLGCLGELYNDNWKDPIPTHQVDLVSSYKGRGSIPRCWHRRQWLPLVLLCLVNPHQSLWRGVNSHTTQGVNLSIYGDIWERLYKQLSKSFL